MRAASLLAAAALCALGCAPAATTGDAPSTTAPRAAAPASSEASGSLRLSIRLTSIGPQIISRVASRARVNRRDPYKDAATFYRAYDKAGRLVAERGFVLETDRHVDIAADDGSLTGAHAQVEEPVMTLQIPLAGSEIDVVRLYRRGGDGKGPDAAPELIGEVRP